MATKRLVLSRDNATIYFQNQTLNNAEQIMSNSMRVDLLTIGSYVLDSEKVAQTILEILQENIAKLT